MPRQSRIVIPQMPHHIIQRGNSYMDVFDESKNYRYFDNSEWQDYLAEEDEDMDREI